MAIRSFGASFSFASQAIPNIRDISISESEAAEIDVTVHSSTSDYRLFIGGLKDGGSVTISGLHSDSNPLADASDDGTPKQCMLTLSDSTGATFNGVLKGYGISLGLDDAVEYTATIKISGPVNYA